MTKKLMTISEFCAAYCVSRSTFYRLAEAHAINPVKIGRATRIAMIDAEAWFATLAPGGEANSVDDAN